MVLISGVIFWAHPAMTNLITIRPTPIVSLPIAALVSFLLFLSDSSSQERPITSLPDPNGAPTPVPDLKDGKADPGTAARLGAAAFAKGDWNRARELYLRMVKAEPENALALSNLAAAEYQLQNYDAAKRHFEASLHIDPNLVESWIALGLIQFQSESWFAAISSFAKAIHLQESNARAHRYLALTAWKVGWTAAAELELQRAIELNSKDSEAHFNLAIMYLERGDPAYELARRHYYRAVDLGAEPDKEIEARINTENR